MPEKLAPSGTAWNGPKRARGCLHLLGHALGVCPLGIERQKTPVHLAQGGCSSATGLDKRGLSAQLQAVGCHNEADFFFGDEMRVGLIGKVQWVWTPRGVKIEQEVEYAYEGAYLNLIVNGLLGKLDWEWTANIKSVSIAAVVKQCQGREVKVIV